METRVDLDPIPEVREDPAVSVGFLALDWAAEPGFSSLFIFYPYVLTRASLVFLYSVQIYLNY